MNSKPVKLNITSLFEGTDGLQGEDLLTPGCWAIVRVEANKWGQAEVTVVEPSEAKKEDIVNPQDLLIYYAEGFEVPGKSKGCTFKLSWENGTKPDENTQIDENGMAEMSYGGYDDNGIEIVIDYFLFKDVTLEKITQLVEKTFAKDMRGLISEIEDEAKDDQEYARDPSAYYGVSNYDFISSSDMKKRF